MDQTMEKECGVKIAEKLRKKGFTLTGWARANGFHRRTVNDFLYAGTGHKRGGPVTESIKEALERDGIVKPDAATLGAEKCSVTTK
ncbi:hypothetical protein [uncultured Desulfosarcina sp.]|uniref:hypothetical protein n=1 Tax=uncultured Desulfosarcina sp. TaxID=218289 RepID=UPI0029C8A60E|nr:hypothetical protein [uncultured Desulfosarcina sp.]